MNTTCTTTSVGVIVGRFQVPELHAGHRHLIDTAAARHTTLIIMLGVSGAFPNDKDPLTYAARERSIKRAYPHAWVRPIFDHPSDEVWSQSLDEQIELMFPGGKAVMYGARDSFLKVYSGKHATYEVESIPFVSGTDIRRQVTEHPIHTPEFLAGIIYRELERSPVSYQTVDIAVLSPARDKVLLGSKQTDGGHLRFVGGFVDVADGSLEQAALRELHEEAPGITVDSMQYLGSFRSNDRRYLGTKDSILTTLFMTTYIDGHTYAGDDLNSLVWVALEDVESLLVPEHRRLGSALMCALNRSSTLVC